jgi:hypothetical protein
MQLNSLLFIFAFAVAPCQGVRVLSSSAHQASTFSGATRAAWLSLVQTEVTDRQFWASEWGNLEATLLQLEATADEQVAPANKTTKLPGTDKAAKMKSVASPATASNKKEAKRSSPLTGKKINLNPKKVSDLLPALAMLKGLYEEGKERISQLNAKEKQSKQRFEVQQKDHLARLATIEGRFKNHTLSEEFRTNETRDENRMFNYWEKVRERQHRQFHTSLKIQHGTMEKEKMMIDAYEKTIAGTANKAQVQKEIGIVSGVPEVVFLQFAWRSAAKYFSDALSEVRAAKEDLRKEPPLV